MAAIRKTLKLTLVTLAGTALPLCAKTYNVELTLEVKESYFLKSTDKRVKVTLRNNTPEDIGLDPRGPSKDIGHIHLKIKHQGKTLPLRKRFRGERDYTPLRSGKLKPKETYVAEWNLYSFYNFNEVGKYRIQATFESEYVKVEKKALREIGVENIEKWRSEHPPMRFKGKSDWHEFRLVENPKRAKAIQKLKKQLNSGKPSEVASAFKILHKHPDYHFKQPELTRKVFKLLNSDNFRIRKTAFMYLYKSFPDDEYKYFNRHRREFFEKYESIIEVDKLKEVILRATRSEDFKFRLAMARALAEDSHLYSIEDVTLWRKVPYTEWFTAEKSEKIRMHLLKCMGAKELKFLRREIPPFLEHIVLHENFSAKIRKQALQSFAGRRHCFRAYRAAFTIRNAEAPVVYRNSKGDRIESTLGEWAEEYYSEQIKDRYKPRGAEDTRKFKKIRQEMLGTVPPSVEIWEMPPERP